MNEMTRVFDTSIAQNAHALLLGRRSVRHYRTELPPADMLERILASAAMAPSAHNRQPWRYFVVTDDGIKVRLANVMGTRLAADRRSDGDAEAAVQLDVSRSFQRITGAPVVIVVAMTLAEMDLYPDELRARAEYLMAVQSTAMATQNLLLAAHAEGLGICWMCAPLFCSPEVKLALGVPEDWQLQGLLTLGYPARPGKLKPRKPLSEFVVFADAPGGRGRDE
jgi:coenzyme F420-0:L-glutamate ligase/coenzyme F420-1:gamma-L-glutamate ligase